MKIPFEFKTLIGKFHLKTKGNFFLFFLAAGA
jgi:hypothetical protein